VSDHVCCGCHDEEMYRAGQESGNPADGWVGEREEFVLPSLLGLNAHFLLPKPVMDFLRVSGAGLTEAGVPPLTLVSPGTPSEPSASPAAETSGREGAADEILAARTTGAVGGKSVRGVCRELASGGLHRDAAAPSVPDASVGGRDVRGVEGHAAIQTAGDLGTATQPCEPPAAVLDTPRIAGIKPGRTSLAPDAGSLPARPHGGPEDQAGAAAPACRCGHESWEHTWRCNAQLAPDEWCDCIEWREVEPECRVPLGIGVQPCHGPLPHGLQVTEREALADLALAVARLNLTKCNCIRWDAKRTAMDALEQALRVLTPPEPEYPWAQLDDTEMARRDGWAVE
jgi:hypothetical protein